MTQDDILSFSASVKTTMRVDAQPSGVLELLYAQYFLSKPDLRSYADTLPWVQQLLDKRPELIEALRTFWPEEEASGFEMLFPAFRFGYIYDTDPERFIHDVETLPERFLAQVDPKEIEGYFAKVFDHIDALRDGETMTRYKTHLTELWRELAPLWNGHGLAAVRAECERFSSQLAQHQDVLRALPKHHFSQFETFADRVNEHQETGRIVVTPLYFASSGGYVIDFNDTLFIGYGLQSEPAYYELSERVQQSAAQMKAFADPTRLMILTLIARFEKLTMTVGDLADQLDVRQPTVSGHLKVLREADLVSFKKHGTRSTYTLNEQTVEATLARLRELLITS